MNARLLLLALFALTIGGGATVSDVPKTPEFECEINADTLWDDPRWEAEDWSPLLPDAHQLVLENDHVSACGARVRHIENLILEYTGRYVALDSAQAIYFDAGYLDVSPVLLRTKELRMRGRNDQRLGRIGDSAKYFFRAATYADSLRPTHAAKVSHQAAISASTLGRFDLRDRYLDRAEAALPEALRRSDSDEGRFALSIWASILGERASALEDAAERATVRSRTTESYRRALAINSEALRALKAADRQLDGGEHAQLLQQRARILLRMGEAGDALAAVLDAFRLLATEEGDTPSQDADIAIQRGDIEAALGEEETAREHYLAAQTIAISAGLASVEGDALVALGLFEERIGRLPFAERAFRAAVSVQEADRERTGLREWTASAFANRQGASRGLARVLLAQNDVRGALAALDATRARAFQDLRRFRARHRALTGDRRRHVDALVDSLEATRRRITAAGDDLLQRENDLIAYQDSLSAALGIKPLAATPLDLTALQSHLGAAERDVVAYQIGDSTSTAFVVTADTITAVTLPAGRGDVTRTARRMLAPWLADAPDPAADLNAAHALYRLIFESVEPLLTAGRPLTIVPDGVLAHVPFGMLTRAPSESYADADYLMRGRAITLELAVGLIGQTQAGADGGVVVFGRSEFDGAPSDTRGAALGALPHVVAEVQQVGRHAARSMLALNAEATESALDRVAPTASVLHIATHAVADPELPMNSRVILSADPDGAESAEDGQIHLYELQNRDLDAHLVVLSGCSTADGELQSGEGLMGMGYGVRVAGAASSIATLWAVDDEATVFLMDALYAGLADGLGKDEALRRAQLAYLDAHDGLEASPFFWAAPILSGAPEPISLGAPSRGWIWVLGIALVGALAWRLTRRTA